MEKEKAFQMLEILKKDEKTLDDSKFVQNNLDGFATWLFNVATNELISDGVAEDKVYGLLAPLVEINKMLGASEFSDFVNVANAFESEGLL
jgi:hypothetical protein